MTVQMKWSVAILALTGAVSAAATDKEVGDLERALAFYETRPGMEQPQAAWQRPPEGLDDLRAGYLWLLPFGNLPGVARFDPRPGVDRPATPVGDGEER